MILATFGSLNYNGNYIYACITSGVTATSLSSKKRTHTHTLKAAVSVYMYRETYGLWSYSI
jgi:hypothetical protein